MNINKFEKEIKILTWLTSPQCDKFNSSAALQTCGEYQGAQILEHYYGRIYTFLTDG